MPVSRAAGGAVRSEKAALRSQRQRWREQRDRTWAQGCDSALEGSRWLACGPEWKLGGLSRWDGPGEMRMVWTRVEQGGVEETGSIPPVCVCVRGWAGATVFNCRLNCKL